MTTRQPDDPPELAKQRSSQDQASDHTPSIDQLGSRLDELLATSPVLPPTGQGPIRIGRFEIGRPLGYGSFGVVYAGYDPQLDRSVAIKLPRPEVLADTEKRGRFTAEANLAATLDHPGIVPVYEAQLDGPTPYLVSKLIAGPSLAKWLEDVDSLPEWQGVARFMAKIARAVHYAHGEGIFHRDLKPSNVLLVHRDGDSSTQNVSLNNYEPRLTDFGLAKLVDANLADTRSSLLIGTPLYMAPEQIEGEQTKHYAAIDIYSMGIMLYELVTGHPPREGANYAELLDGLRNDAPPSAAAHVNIPRALDRISKKCLARNPAARYATAEELANNLEACAAGEAIQAKGLSFRERLDYWLRQKKRITDAGWFAIWNNALIVVWLGCGAVLTRIFLTDMTWSEYVTVMMQFTFLALAVHFPAMWIGWQTVKRKRWAIIAGLLLTGFNSVPAVIPLFTEPIVFIPLYRNVNPVYQLLFHTMISLCFVTSFALYLCAWIGSRRMADCEGG